jgi:hypothetical protein
LLPGHGSRAFRLILYERLRRFHPYPHAGLDNRPFDIGQFMAAGRHHGLHPDLTLTSDPVRRLRPPGALDDLAPGRRRYRFVWYRPVDGQPARRDADRRQGHVHSEGIPPHLIRPM